MQFCVGCQGSSFSLPLPGTAALCFYLVQPCRQNEGKLPTSSLHQSLAGNAYDICVPSLVSSCKILRTKHLWSGIAVSVICPEGWVLQTRSWGGLKATWNGSRKSSWTTAFLVSLSCVAHMTSCLLTGLAGCRHLGNSWKRSDHHCHAFQYLWLYNKEVGNTKQP